MSQYNYIDNIQNIADYILNNEHNFSNKIINFTNHNFINESNYLNDSLNDTYNDSQSDNDSQTDTNTDNDSDDNSQTQTDSYNSISNIPSDDIVKIMKINYSYPDQSDPYFQHKIYKKREYYYHKIPSRSVLTDYQDIKKFRDMACGGNFRLRSQQSLLSNFINPDTPCRGVLIYHGVGTGKCVHPQTKIDILSNDIWQTIEIANLWNHSGNFTVDHEDGHWQTPSNKCLILI